MPDAHSIPFKQASGNGHYESKQLPNDNADFLVVLGLPTSIGNVTSASASSLDGQLAAYWGTSGSVIKASTQIGLVNLVDGVVTTKATPAGEIVGTTAIQTLTNKTISGSTITGGVSGITKTDVGLGNVDNTSDANKPVSGPQQTALNLKEDKTAKGITNGYAALDGTGKVPTTQLPAVALGGINYQGPWNALSNTPVIPVASAANKGWYYVVTIAGTTMVDGYNEWAIGDWIVSNGATWNKVDNTDAVTSVSGRMGAVVLTKSDVGLDQVDNTSDATNNSAAVTLTNKTISGNNNTLIVRLNADVTGNLPPGNLDGGAGASSGSFWRGDGHWGTPAGGGDVTGPGGSVDGEIALYNGVSGSILKRTSGTGLANVTNGVWQTPIALATVVHRLARGYLNGLTLSNGIDTVNDINIGPGECRDDTNSADIVLSSAMTKQLDVAWAAGTGQGGRDTGAIADATWHIFVIRNPSTLAVDVVMSQNVTTPVMPSGYTQKRRIGSLNRSITNWAGLIPFTQMGNYFQMSAPITDHAGASLGQTASFFPGLQKSCPIGIKVLADFVGQLSHSASAAYMTIYDPDVATPARPNLSAITASINSMGQFQIWTDVSGRVKAATGPAVGTYVSSWGTVGYWDYRTIP